jgi:hypothetical protein
MSHSAEQMRKKAMARKEAINHAQHANALMPRDGKGHEDHKSQDMAEDDRSRGFLGDTDNPNDQESTMY